MGLSIDVAELAQRLEFEKEDVEMLLEAFYEGAIENIEILENAIKEKDYETIASAAHSIKGSAANLLLDEIALLAKEIELSAKSQDGSYDYTQSYKDLETMLQSLGNG